ncbi:MAG: hypothetical protein AMXMBFR34_18050 [Myxococcaceae bacterium]
MQQPGDFHIDMHVTLLPNGKAVVNDAASVFALQKQWLTEDLERSKPAPPAAGASKGAVARFKEEKPQGGARCASTSPTAASPRRPSTPAAVSPAAPRLRERATFPGRVGPRRGVRRGAS